MDEEDPDDVDFTGCLVVLICIGIPVLIIFLCSLWGDWLV